MHILLALIFVVTSIVALTFIIERGIALRWPRIIPPNVVYAVQSYHSENQLPQLRGVCEQNPSAMSRLLLFATEHLDWSKSETVDLLETRARHEVTRLERGLIILEIVVGIAPLLGLVGTIVGLIILFGKTDLSSMQNHAEFAQGISTALWATFYGLVIAIPALVAWSYYSRKVETLAIEMESLCDEFLRKHYRQEEPPVARHGAIPQPHIVEHPQAFGGTALPKPSAQI
ncbi:MAG: MotA/TolQ/ExbB proton channel family protein [Verrucomicrobia subdivision 3 bacterium]|nr:MotA/TolQ/ExbB proton channel family protein [Limisphaerales bacterium]